MEEIIEWMEKVEQVQASTSSYHNLQPAEEEIIIEQFKVTLDTCQDTQQMMVMTRATRLLVSVLGEQQSSREGLVDILQKLLSYLLLLTEPEVGLNELMIDLVTDCLEEDTMKMMVLEGLARKMLVIITNNKMAYVIRTSWLKMFNIMLTGIKYEVKEAIMVENPEEVEQLVDFLQTCGDFDIQSSLVEAMLRFTTKTNRPMLASTWFSNNSPVQKLFTRIKIKDFEIGCRNFLNGFNKELGDDRLVFSIPSISCQVDGKQMFKPPDEEYKQFWVDFNIGPSTISLYHVKEEGSTELWDLFTIQQDVVTCVSTRINGTGNTTITIDVSMPNSNTTTKQILLVFYSTPPLSVKLLQLLSMVFPRVVEPVPPPPVPQTPHTPGRSCPPNNLLLPKSPYTTSVMNPVILGSNFPQPSPPEVSSCEPTSLPCGQALGSGQCSHEDQHELADYDQGRETKVEEIKLIPETPDEEKDECNYNVGEEKVTTYEGILIEKTKKENVRSKAAEETVDIEECLIIPASLPSPRKHRKGWKKVKSKLSLNKHRSTDTVVTNVDNSSPSISASVMESCKHPVEESHHVTSAPNVTVEENSISISKSSSSHDNIAESSQVKHHNRHADSSVPPLAVQPSPLIKQVASLSNNGRSCSTSSCDSLSGLAKLLKRKPKLCLSKKRARLTKSPELSQIRESQESKYMVKQLKAMDISNSGGTIISKKTADKRLGIEKKSLGCGRKKVFKPWLASRSGSGQHAGKSRRSLVRKAAINMKRSAKLFSDDEEEDIVVSESPLYNPIVASEIKPSDNARVMRSCVQNREKPSKSVALLPSIPYQSGFRTEVQKEELCVGSSGDSLDEESVEQQQIILMWAMGVLEMVSRRNDVEPNLREVWGQIRSIAEIQEARE